MLSVAQRHVPQLSVPLEILFELAVHRTVNVETLLLDGFHIARQVILLTELVITVRIQSDPRIHRSHDGIPVPGLELDEQPVGEFRFESRVARGGTVEIPVLVKGRRRYRRISRPAVLTGGLHTGIGIGINPVPTVVLQRVSHVNGRHACHRKVVVGQAAQRDTVTVEGIESIVLQYISRIR